MLRLRLLPPERARRGHRRAPCQARTASSASGLYARSLAPLDPRDTCRGSEDARAPVVPADAEARRILGQNLLNDATLPRLSSPLRLDDDPVSHARVHGSALPGFDLVNEG